MHIKGTKGHLTEENQQCVSSFFRTNHFKERMQKFVALLTKEKGKMATNEWEIVGSDILRALYRVYKKIRTILFSYSLIKLFRQRYISSVKSYKYLNKLIS